MQWKLHDVKSEKTKVKGQRYDKFMTDAGRNFKRSTHADKSRYVNVIGGSAGEVN